MPANKHKRKASSHTKGKAVKKIRSTGFVVSHPKLFFSVGLFLVGIGAYLLAFESQDNVMFGVAMLSLIVGVVTTIYANFSAPNKKIA